RELANVLADLRRFDEALAECAIARDLDPQSPYTYCTRGRVLAMTGRPEEAKEDYRQAIGLSVDVTFAISSLVELCQSHSERRAALQFVEQELIRQVVFGDGLLAFRDLAQPVLEPEELLASLRVALKERPDLWHAHSAVIQQLTEMGRYEEALLCANEATARFPLLPRLWLDLARIHQARHHHSAEVQALEEALQINPGWSHAVRQLAGAYHRDGQLTRASEILQNAVALDPLNAVNHGALADVLWHLDDKEAAVEQARRAILLHPGYDWPWRAIREWSTQLKKPELAVNLARDLTQRRGGEALSWLRLAEMVNGPEDLQECLAALDKAVALNPRCEPAWDLRALSLARANRWDEALAACRPPAWKTPPVTLRSRAAWIQRQRGCLPEAIAEMRAVLKENPDNYWCWRELADWLWDSGSFEEARQAALKLTRLAPMDAVPFGYLG
ncbi:MAG TPA: tetratricopeptide repeat protein, partial [Candidatus Dormibacteraeota bacterium]|nr:tetratricopeptide repeat protein [Candidatus Dormibacteraeota bacterium]